MKKVININFQGQVIAIEETAYEILKSYIESLKRYFSKEEGGDEIVNDIENRIAELFGNRLKLGINCITDEDVESIISSIGRPEEFDTEYVEESNYENTGYSNEGRNANGSGKTTTEAGAYPDEERKSLHRNSNDVIIAGVCSGLANYFKTDPAWIRLIFVVFFGILFWVYIILWIVLKSKPLESNLSKRIYRNPNDKYIGGVCGGIAAYFKIDSWIPRVLFLFPLFFNIVGIFGYFPLNNFFRDIDFNWNLNGGVLLLYIALWIILPEAKTVKQKLEMMGEEEYIKTIRNKVSDNISGSKTRSGKSETSYTAHAVSSKTSFDKVNTTQADYFDSNSSNTDSSDTGTSEMPPEPPASINRTNVSSKSESSGCLNVLVIFLKIIFFTFVGIFALVMVGLLIGLLFAGAQLVPLKSLFIDSGFETNILIASLALLVIVPIVSIIVWIVRRSMKAKSRPLIGVFSIVLWITGIVLAAVLATKVADKFRVESSTEQIMVVAPVNSDKMYLEMEPYMEDYAEFKIGFGYGTDIDELPYTTVNEDSLLFSNINLQIGQSNDSLFHVRTISATHGKNLRQAKNDISEFTYNITHNDSIIVLPEFFLVPVDHGFRSQSVTVEVLIPAGKSVEVSDALSEYKNNRPPSVARKRIRSYNSSYTPYEHSSL